MKIKRFKGKTIRQALHNVRAELGADAVILSNNSVEGGVEVLAATDTDWPVQAEKPATSAAAAGTRPTTVADLESRFGETAPAPASERNSDALLGRKADQASRLQQKADELFGGSFQRNNKAGTTSKATSNDEDLTVSRELRSLRTLVERQLAGLAWGEHSREQPQRAQLMEHLLAFGLPPRFCQKLADQTTAGNIKDAWKESMVKLIEQMPSRETSILDTGGVVALVGPTGVGKTTTVAKLAGQFTLRHGPGSVALITVDGHRIGTQEQLRAFGRILDIPVTYAADHEELKNLLERFSDRKLVIVDSSGISHRDPMLMQHMSMFSEGMPEAMQTYVVVAANTQPKGIVETINAFRRFDVQGAIVTKLDEAESMGGAISALASYNMPLIFTTDGQQVPDDLAVGSPYNLVQRGIDLMREDNEAKNEELNTLSFGPLMAERYA